MTENVKKIEKITFDDYNGKASKFWENTKDHDVSQNYTAFLAPFDGKKSLDILDFGCGPGRDILYFKSIGHNPVGLDGASEFCEMARKLTGCRVLEQSFNDLDLVENSFDGVFANASMFHVPRKNLAKVLKDLYKALRPNGILFTSNPRGDDDGWQRPGRYGNFMQYDQSLVYLEDAGFKIIDHYYRPPNLPRDQQNWLAMVSKVDKN
ncbi:MAG: class I SAM-dependent methyltransferase [Emcibacteraceae bacterium]|nr:class I SAM-dependent methyltransferase [Emcibacteraceae bacterium]